jgi:hypothetical protein
MKLRFVAGNSIISRAIIAAEKLAMPFTPSHVEAVSESGLNYIGSHLGGGMEIRPIDYDAGQFDHELILDLNASGVMPNQDRTFYEGINAMVGEGYDWPAIFDFVLPKDFHIADHVICSAACTLALRKCEWLKYPVAAPAHLVSPRDLLLMISARMAVPGI